jgi:hypothetical protein
MVTPMQFSVDGLIYLHTPKCGAMIIGYDRELPESLIIQPVVEYNGHKYLVTEIANGALSECNCKHITAEYITSIGNAALSSSDNLVSIELANCCFINAFAFMGCHSLETVIGEHIEYIDTLAFDRCRKLKNMNAGEEIKYISSMAFDGVNDSEEFHPRIREAIRKNNELKQLQKSRRKNSLLMNKKSS